MQIGSTLAAAAVGLGLATQAQADSAAGTWDHAIVLAAAGTQVACRVDDSAGLAHLYLLNNGAAAIAPGTRIMWGAQPGSLSGVALVGPNGLPSGDWQYVGGYVGVHSCDASVID